VKRNKKSKRLVVLTQKGKAEASMYDVDEGTRQGLDDVANGRTLPAREAFDRIRRKYRIPRWLAPGEGDFRNYVGNAD
jgi:hypothetical protein